MPGLVGFWVRERSLPFSSAVEFQPSFLSPAHHRAHRAGMHGANRRNAVRRMRKQKVPRSARGGNEIEDRSYRLLPTLVTLMAVRGLSANENAGALISMMFRRPDTLMQSHAAQPAQRVAYAAGPPRYCNLTTHTTMPETAGVNLMASTERGREGFGSGQSRTHVVTQPFPLLASLRRGNSRQAAKRRLSIGLPAGVDQGSQIPRECGAKLQQAGLPAASRLPRSGSALVPSQQRPVDIKDTLYRIDGTTRPNYIGRFPCVASDNPIRK
jgi:hypothetical protein